MPPLLYANDILYTRIESTGQQQHDADSDDWKIDGRLDNTKVMRVLF